MSFDAPDIPLLLQQLFNKSLRIPDGPSSQNESRDKPGLERKIEEEVVDEHTDPIGELQHATLQFLIPEGAFKLESHASFHAVSSDRQKQGGSQPGESYANQLLGSLGTPTTGIIIDRVNWNAIYGHQEHRQFVVSRALQLLNWIQQEMDPVNSQSTSSIRRSAASMLLELFEMLLVVGSKLNLLHLEYHLNEKWMSGDDTAHAGNDAGTTTVMQDGKPTHVSFEDPTFSPVSTTFTFELLQTLSMVTDQASNKESYVMFIGILQNREIGLAGKLRCLEYFAKVLKTFTIRRATHLMNSNLIIVLTLLKDGPIVHTAERSLRHVMENCEEEPSDNGTQKTQRTQQPQQQQPQRSRRQPLGDHQGPVNYYLDWLIGIARYFGRYVCILGSDAAVKQDDDYHGVGPNSCASLLSKVITVLGTTFVSVHSSDREDNNQQLTPCQPHYRRTHLQWSPFTQDVRLNADLTRWVSFYGSFVSGCFAELVWRYSHIQSASLLNEFESVNLMSPLDDGSGELEMTPISTALITSLVVLHSDCLKLVPSTSRTILPLVLSSHWYTSLGFSTSLVLLRSALLLTQTPSKLEWLNCLVVTRDDSTLFHLRRQRLQAFGLEMFCWASLASGCLRAVPNDVFQTIHGFPLRPTHLIAVVLTALARASTEPSKQLRKLILYDCIEYWLQQYPLPISLHILQCVPSATVTLCTPIGDNQRHPKPPSASFPARPSAAPSDDASSSALTTVHDAFELQHLEPSIVTAVVTLFKNQILKHVCSSLFVDEINKGCLEADSDICSSAILKMSRSMLTQNVRPIDYGDSVHTYLTLLQTIFANRTLTHLQRKITADRVFLNRLRQLADQLDIEKRICKSRSHQSAMELLGFTLSDVRQRVDQAVTIQQESDYKGQENDCPPHAQPPSRL